MIDPCLASLIQHKHSALVGLEIVDAKVLGPQYVCSTQHYCAGEMQGLYCRSMHVALVPLQALNAVLCPFSLLSLFLSLVLLDRSLLEHDNAHLRLRRCDYSLPLVSKVHEAVAECQSRISPHPE